MSELKLVVGDEAEKAAVAAPDLVKSNPMDALNRRDIELIKRSLATMHKDCTELRNTIVALHGRQSQAPSKAFFLTLGALALVLVGAFSVARPHLHAAMHGVPALATLSSSDVNR